MNTFEMKIMKIVCKNEGIVCENGGLFVKMLGGMEGEMVL